jgi:hypothetical protein
VVIRGHQSGLTARGVASKPARLPMLPLKCHFSGRAVDGDLARDYAIFVLTSVLVAGIASGLLADLGRIAWPRWGFLLLVILGGYLLQPLIAHCYDGGHPDINVIKP